MSKSTFKKGYKFSNQTNTFEIVEVLPNNRYLCKMFLNGKLLRQKHMTASEITNMGTAKRLPRWKA